MFIFSGIINSTLIVLSHNGPRDDTLTDNFAEVIVASAFWSVMFIGVADALISLLGLKGYCQILWARI